MVWLPHPNSDMPQPFWLGSEFAALLSRMQPGDPAPDDLLLATRRTLAIAGILVPEGHPAEQDQEWSAAIGQTAQCFREKGYAPMAGLIHPFLLAALRRYSRHLIRTGSLSLGDEQSPRRYAAHNESVTRFFHHQLTKTVSAVVGQPVKPSYVYLGSYLGGAQLEKHTDREQCEFSITFCLDFAPEPEWATPWPIQLHPGSGKVTVYQGIGDGLFYLGRKLPHSRETLPAGNSSTSIFFHYVPENFSGLLD